MRVESAALRSAARAELMLLCASPATGALAAAVEVSLHCGERPAKTAAAIAAAAMPAAASEVVESPDILQNQKIEVSFEERKLWGEAVCFGKTGRYSRVEGGD